MHKFIRFYKILVLLFFGMFSNTSNGQLTILNNSDSNRIVCLFSLPDYSIRDTSLPVQFVENGRYSYICIKNPSVGIVDSVGYPYLPFFTYSFELPNGAFDINVSISDINYDYIKLNKQILPCQEDINIDNIPLTFIFKKNNNFYSSNNYYFSSECILSELFIIRGVNGAKVTILPFNYNPFDNLLRIIKSAKIEVSFRRNNSSNLITSSICWDNIYRNTFVNHSPSMRSPVAEKYLILTIPEYEDAIQYFANYKQSIGYDVTVRTLGANERTPAAIKGIIQGKYNDPVTKPDYVLLVGDNPDIPPYEGDSLSSEIDSPITDVPYVFLDGDDYYRDALIGRWPVHSTSEIQVITNKTIYMEMNMHLWDKKAVFIAGEDDNNMIQGFFMEGHDYAMENTFLPNGYLCFHLPQPAMNTALTALNDNPSFYIYSGHGNFQNQGPVGRNNGYSWYIDKNFIRNSSHKTFPSVFSFACKTGNFAYLDTSIAEYWINGIKGSVTFFGSSVITYVMSDLRIEKELFGDAFYDENTIGGIIAIGMKRYYDAFFSVGSRAKRYMKAYNLMGDPSYMVRGLGCANDYFVERMKLGLGDEQYYITGGSVVFDGENHAGNGSKLIIKAGDEVMFKNGFIASSGSTMSVNIEDCVSNRDVIFQASDSQDSILPRSLFHVPHKDDSTLSINVYPNPTSDFLYINIHEIGNKPLSITLYDIFGKIVKCLTMNEIDNNMISLNISHLPSGCYYFVISVGERRTIKCIIKQ